MTEAEWLACDDPEPMLKHLGRKAKVRKLRLFMCACCRRVWHLIQEPHCCEAVEVAEAFVERKADRNTLAITHEEVNLFYDDTEADGLIDAREATTYTVEARPSGAEFCASCAAASVDDYTSDEGAGRRRSEKAAQASMLRCVFGNAFRPVAFEPVWHNASELLLARAAYEERLMPSGQLDPARLAVLSDALEELGATGAILSHLRSSGPHVRGCWALDLILGRK